MVRNSYRHIVMALLAILTALWSIPNYAASDAATVVRGLLQAGKLDEAQVKVDSYLKKDPNDVDAIMMQGNVILNRYFATQADVSMSANDNESIYDDSIGFLSEPVYVLPEDVATQVITLWNHCLELDPAREDIYKGVAYVEAISLQKKLLIDQLVRMKKALPQAKELYFNMGDYARMFSERGRFDDAMDIYQTILKLYPQVSALDSDVAALYLQHGDLDKAHSYILQSVNKPGADEMVYKNALIILVAVGDDSNTLTAARSLAALRQDHSWLLYSALVHMARGEAGWQKELKQYSRGAAGADSDTKLADYLASVDYKGDLTGYKHAIELAGDATTYQILLNRAAMRALPDEFQPVYDYADNMTWSGNYHAAQPLWEQLLSRKPPLAPDEREAVQLRYGWLLWESGKRDDSLTVWTGLLGSEHFYIHSAAAYFLGKYALDGGDHKTALHYFGMVSEQASQSKYATMAWNLSNSLSEKQGKQ